MLSIFQFFATKTDASVLRMLNGSPEERLLKPIAEYITSKGGRIHTRLGCKEVLYEDDAEGTTKVTGLRLARAGKEQIARADAYIAALDVPGAIPSHACTDKSTLHASCIHGCQLCACAMYKVVNAPCIHLQRHKEHVFRLKRQIGTSASICKVSADTICNLVYRP